MRRIFVLALVLLLAACGSSSAPKPTPTRTAPGVTDATTHVNTAILSAHAHHHYMLVYISMHNRGHSTFAPSNPTQFVDEALVEPNSSGTLGVCSADNSTGPGLQYSSIPAGATRTGWLRCDYPTSTHVLAIFWLSHDLGNYRVSGG